jgi:putative transposase
MNNHFHLLLEIDEPEEISRFMAGLDRAYTHYHHRVYGTTGLLWQGRFKLQLVQKQTYLAACGRYIERNPVRADLVQAAHEYLYGSARYYCAGVPDGITTEDPTYSMTGLSHSQRQMRYMEFLRDFNADEEALFRNNEESVGDRRFVAQFHVVRGRLMPRRRGREVRIYRL